MVPSISWIWCRLPRNFTKTGENDADVNGDGVVDILDLVTVATTIGGVRHLLRIPHALSTLTAADVKSWIALAQGLKFTDARLERGIQFLEQLLAALTPKETMLLPNYPNPFNPETWIPYHLSQGAEVSITIYDRTGATVREIALRHQAAGYYADRGGRRIGMGGMRAGSTLRAGFISIGCGRAVMGRCGGW